MQGTGSKHYTNYDCVNCCLNNSALFLVPSSVNDLTVAVTSSTSATITWRPPQALNGIIINYHITLTRQTSRNTVVVKWILEPDNELTHSVTTLGIVIII